MAWHKHIEGAPELPEGLWYKVSYFGAGIFKVSIRKRRIFSPTLAYGLTLGKKTVQGAASDAYYNMLDNEIADAISRENEKWLWSVRSF